MAETSYMESVGDGGGDGYAKSRNIAGVSTVVCPTRMHRLCVSSLGKNQITGIRACAPTDSIV